MLWKRHPKVGLIENISGKTQSRLVISVKDFKRRLTRQREAERLLEIKGLNCKIPQVVPHIK